MSFLHAIASGFLGACALTAVHETLRRLLPEAPRMDVLGREAVATLLEVTHHEPPSERNLQAIAMAGDIISNTGYYAMVALGDSEEAVRHGIGLGGLAGIASVVLPQMTALSEEAGSRTKTTALLTVALYLGGGLVAGACYRVLSSKF